MYYLLPLALFFCPLYSAQPTVRFTITIEADVVLSENKTGQSNSRSFIEYPPAGTRQHYINQQQALSRLSRIAQQRGLLLIEDWQTQDPQESVKLLKAEKEAAAQLGMPYKNKNILHKAIKNSAEHAAEYEMETCCIPLIYLSVRGTNDCYSKPSKQHIATMKTLYQLAHDADLFAIKEHNRLQFQKIIDSLEEVSSV